MTAPTAPPLLDSGAPTPITTFLLVHHGLRRDLGRIGGLLHRPAPLPDIEALRAHWSLLRSILELHHLAEDSHLFPPLRAAHPELVPVMDALDLEHGLLDGLLHAVDDAVAAPDLDVDRAPARDAVADLATLLHAHLTSEEAHLVPVMRAAPPTTGPPPGGGLDPQIAVPWSADGVHRDVVAALTAGLPQAIAAQVPGWLSAWEVRRSRTFGAGLRVGASTTAVPDADGFPSPDEDGGGSTG